MRIALLACTAVLAVGSLTACSPAASVAPVPTSTAAQPTPPLPPATTQAPLPSSSVPSHSASASPAIPSPAVDPAVLGAPAPVGSFVLGDSISLTPGVGPLLARFGYPVTGFVGQSASDGYLRTYLSSPTAQAAPAWVIELGTNNSGDPTTVARLEHWVDLIDSLRTPGAPQQVRWVTPHRPASYTGGMSAWTLDAFNAELARLASTRPWLRLLDFASLAAAHPEWFAADSMHVHPDAAGQAALLALIAGPSPVPLMTPAPLVTVSPSPSPASSEPEFVNEFGEATPSATTSMPVASPPASMPASAVPSAVDSAMPSTPEFTPSGGATTP